MKPIDKKTVDDIVGLIEAEMDEFDGECGNSPERLAGVILGRLGYEIPEPSPFPEILEGSMSMKITNNEVQVLMGTTVLARHIFLSKAIDKRIINTYRILAALLNLLETGMKVAELYLTMKADVEKSYPGVGLSTYFWGGNLEYEHFVDALREAGVDI